MSKIKPSKGAPYARILGVGGYRPTRVVPNEVILEKIDSSDEWIRSRSGIETRHWAGPEETVAAMSVEASGKALADAGIDASRIGAVVVSTVSHFSQTPAIATEIADRLGTDKAAAFDISAGCAGFGYGLTLAKGMVVEGSAEYVLVIGVERLSDLTDLEDRATAFLFGDGAGAVVVGPSQEPAIGPTVWGSEGDKAETIKQTVSWDRFRIGDVSELPLDSEGNVKFPAITQEGQAVFRWAVFEMAKVAQQALDAAGISPDDLDVFIPHQANVRIIDSMVKTLKLPEHVTVARDIRTTGNTSAASIPLAMERLLATGDARSGDTALVIGFGAGLVYAATVVTSLGTPCRITPVRNGEQHRPPPTRRAATPSGQQRRSAVMAATQEEIVAGLAEIVNEIAGIPVEDVKLDKSFTDDLDVDSLSMVEVVVAAEERFDVKIPDDDVKNLKTVGDATKYILDHQA